MGANWAIRKAVTDDTAGVAKVHLTVGGLRTKESYRRSFYKVCPTQSWVPVLHVYTFLMTMTFHRYRAEELNGAREN